MNASHHPSDDLLWSYAAGSLDEPSSILIATHLALCPKCRGVVAKAEQVGGELFDDVQPVQLGSDALDSVLSRLDDDQEEVTAPVVAAADDDPIRIPRPLKDYVSGSVQSMPWRWLGPGVHYAEIGAAAKGPKVGLLRIAPGTKVPMHGHSGSEMTMVLAGGYSDATGHFVRGDVEAADDNMVHQPIADAGEDCFCLVVTEGQLRPTGMIAKVLQPFFRI
jgi:putative transcriptional regulator